MKLVSILIKTLIFLAVLSIGYYLFGLQAKSKEVELSKRYFNLVQNRTVYVGLTKLNPKDINFDWNKSNLVGILRETNKNGLEIAKSDKEKEIYIRQKSLLDKVFATKSYEEGVAILKSKDSVTLLTDQTKLIEELRESPLLRLGWR